MVLLALQQLEQARANLRSVVETTPRLPREDFAVTLRAVRDSGFVEIEELAEWLGVSRSTLYRMLDE